MCEFLEYEGYRGCDSDECLMLICNESHSNKADDLLKRITTG